MSVSDVRSGAGRKPAVRQSERKARATQGTAPERPADALSVERARERQVRWIVIGASVALAVIVPIARQIWNWLWEGHTRARLDREILRELDS